MKILPGINQRVIWLWQKKEALIWIAALVFLAVSNPADHHYTICPLDNLGISYCPGCGLGRAIGYFFRLDLESSFLSHPLGIPAVILLVYRSVIVLAKPSASDFSTFKY
jgi:hypothetical protein